MNRIIDLHSSVLCMTDGKYKVLEELIPGMWCAGHQDLEGSTTSFFFVFYQFSVQDGCWPKTRGACYSAGAGAILGDVQARSVPSSHRKVCEASFDLYL
jgi:hypothetical protein